jgi:hypothetical protein
LRHRERSLLLCGVVSALLALAAGTADGVRPARLLVPWLAAHAAYLGAAWLVVRGGARTRLWLVVAIGLLPRLALLPAAPPLSEDLYRYLWDGRLVAEGVNPFPRAPSDPSLARYHDGLLDRLNHADVPTIYPPMAQYLFAAAARTAVAPWAWKGALLVLEGILLVALLALLRRRGLAAERIVLYAWNPLVVIESFGNGHVDLAAAAFLLLALALLETRRAATAGGAFACAVLVKYIPLLLVPALLRRRAWAALATALAVGALLFLPFLDAGRSLATGLATYLRHWEFNGSLYAVLRPLFATGDPPRAILSGLVAVAAVAAASKRGPLAPLSGTALFLLAAWIVASPTVYPWYLVMPIALLPLHPDAGLLAFTGLVPLSYVALAAARAGGGWTLPAWVPGVEYGGWAAAGLAAWAVTAAATRAGASRGGDPGAGTGGASAGTPRARAR